MSISILVVDDSAVMRSIIVKTLRLAGADVSEIYQAGNGREALDVLEKNWVDLVIADINMPVMNGLELINEIQSDNALQNLPIVVISTEGSQTRIDELQSMGVEFIHKPFTPEAIRNVFVNKLGVSHAEPS